MTKELVLDIGIGAGGDYIHSHSAQNERRIGVDVKPWGFQELRNEFPEVNQLLASGENLPFKSNTFLRIEIILPYGDLAFPGLQSDHFSLDKDGNTFAEKYPQGWYVELQRVLKPAGQLIIYGDLYVDAKQVKKTSMGLFKLEKAQRLTVEEFYALQTHTTKKIPRSYLSQRIAGTRKSLKETFVKITLESTKVS